MGVVLGKLWHVLFRSSEQYKILIIGLNNAGKTTILYKLHLGEAIQTQPTIGSNVEEIKHNNVRFQAWDLGGQENLRPLWSSYFTQTAGVIFVVDSCDHENLTLAKMELYNVIISDLMKGVPLLVFANKQDAAGSMDAGTISLGLHLADIRDREWNIQGCCALDGTGLDDGMNWIAQKLVEKKKKITNVRT
eukprot:Platyproteum_vivax@DN5963_c0_g1_i1.p1